MGDISFMKSQIDEKLRQGFHCIKLKIGAINFEREIELIESIRKSFSEKEVEIRVDANGAFSLIDAKLKLKRLFDFKIHSIEQPIKQGQIEEMRKLCSETQIPIALDEELIGINHYREKVDLLVNIKPQYIILKPSLLGGWKSCDEWIDIAESLNIGWWVTSALESNIGLNAIAQYVATKQSKMPQGLGTGELFNNNFTSPLEVKNGSLYYNSNSNWDLKTLVNG
jgi:L-alanine-DL-glutamate epimerase-like enolase superfamily enzyme